MSEILAAVLARAAVMLLENLIAHVVKVLAAKFLPSAGLQPA
jgi:hypothetical protein